LVKFTLNKSDINELLEQRNLICKILRNRWPELKSKDADTKSVKRL